MSRFAFFALPAVVTGLAGCSPGAGDHLVGSWVVTSGYVDTLCESVGTDQAAPVETTVNPGDKGITVEHIDGATLSLTHTDFPNCTFLLNARGADTAEVQQVAACVDGNNTKVTLVSGSLLHQGGHLDALLNFTTQKSDENSRNQSCSNDQNLVF